MNTAPIFLPQTPPQPLSTPFSKTISPPNALVIVGRRGGGGGLHRQSAQAARRPAAAADAVAAGAIVDAPRPAVPQEEAEEAGRHPGFRRQPRAVGVDAAAAEHAGPAAAGAPRPVDLAAEDAQGEEG